jgi:predicted Zn finger-like uncharacterized protein
LIIRCEQCSTTYHLDQTFLEPFGSKVRCTRCGHIFWVEHPSFSESESRTESNPQAEPLPISDHETVPALQTNLNPPRKVFWTAGIILLIILAALTARFFYQRYLNPDWDLKDIWSSVLFLSVDSEGNKKISLMDIKKYFAENPKIGRFFIIEGEVKNGYPEGRQKILIRGSLRTAENRVAVSRDVYVGWTFTPEELETLSFAELDQLKKSQPDRFSSAILVPPGKTKPFMILFPPLPPGSTQVSIEVVSSQKIQSPSLLKPPLK